MEENKKNIEEKECECCEHEHHHEIGSSISCNCGHDHGHDHGHSHEHGHGHEEEGNGDLIKLIVGGILYIAVLVVDKLGLIKGDFAKYILLGMYLVPYLIIGLETITGAVKNIAHGEFFDEEFLMTIATVGALVVGEYPEAVAVMLLSAIGEMFEDYAVEKSRDSIAAMMDIAPDHANLLTDEGVREVDPDDVKIGDIIVVKPGERVPLDGVITEGKSMLNTSALTGESVPRSAGVGDEIFSGCVNESGMLKVKVNKVYDDSTVARVLKLVEESEERKARSEGFVTKFARVYTPVVVFVALFIAIALPLILHQDFMTWIYRACNFLVISCPCALVISVPLAFFTGIGSASRYGILIKGSNFIEAASKVKTMVFDKTGTLTKGEFSVTLVSPASGSREELLTLAAAAEKYSTHPIAAAIRAAHGEEIEESRISDVDEISGYGIRVKFDGNEVLAGNAKLMAKYGVGIVETEAAEAIGTTVYVAKAGKFMGTVIISDVIKEEAAEAIADLKKAGAKCVMLTGDKKEVAERVAETIGIDEVHAELLPSDKVAEFEKLLGKGEGKVAFTGDGINDAPVIARADVGIAMGSMGSDAAIEAADIVLMDDDVKKLAKAIAVSKKTMRIVTENIAFSLGVKFLIMVLSVIGLGTMWMAVFADVGVSIIAISNSLRLLKK